MFYVHGTTFEAGTLNMFQEAEYPTVISSDDEMEVFENATLNGSALSKESHFSEPGINCCEREGCDDCCAESHFILNVNIHC